MTWMKVDDQLHDHRKARLAGAAPLGLWVLAGSWAADNLTDGFVPRAVVGRWAPNATRLAAKLVEVGLWSVATRDSEPGWLFHDWAEYQPTKAEVEAKRKVRAEAGAKGGAASGRSRRRSKSEASASASAAATGEAEVNPVPVPVPEGRGARASAAHDPALPPPRRCLKHLNDLTAPACGACRDARLAWEEWSRATRDRPAPLPRAAPCVDHPEYPGHACLKCRAAESKGPSNMRELVDAGRSTP